MPFQQSSGSIGLFQTTDDELDAVRQNIKSLLITNWGERVMHYHMGCNLIEFVFEQMRGDSLREKIADRIIDQMATWLPFVTVVDLRIFFSDDDSSVPEQGIMVRMKFTTQNRPDALSDLEHTVTP